MPGSDSARTTAASWDWHWRRGRRRALPLRANPNVHWTARLLRHVAQRADARTVFELGCAPGAWLAFCATRLGLAASGCDVSPAGVRAARDLLVHAGVDADGVLEASAFDLPAEHRDRHDLVYSFGLVEHFDDLAGILRAHAAPCRPGGLVLVTAPKLTGLSGALYRRASATLMESHRVVTPAALREAAVRAGLAVLDAGCGGPLSAYALLDRVDSRAKRAAGWLGCAALGWTTLGSASSRVAGSVWLVARR
jgi:2-polyprenyl-3-methyl-5-hydroxy-6-metoxy-1,4-benzoquinol methylase